MKRMRVRVIYGVATIFSIILFCVIYHKAKSHTIKPEDLFPLDRSHMFTRIEFEGQRRNIVLTNKHTLHILSEAFKQPAVRGFKGGITYHAKITIDNTYYVNISVRVYDDGDGFSVAIPRRIGLFFEDPYFYIINIAHPIDPLLTKVFNALNDDKYIGSTLAY